MSDKATDAAQLLLKDGGDKQNGSLSGFRKAFAEDRPIQSLLQRQDKTLEDMLEAFDWHQADDESAKCYADNFDPESPTGTDLQCTMRNRLYFLLCGWREIQEDFGREDVSCLRDLRTPCVTARTPLMAVKDVFKEK